MTDVRYDDKDYLEKLTRQKVSTAAVFMLLAYWEYLLALNPEFAKHKVGRDHTNVWRKDPLYVAAEDFLAFNMRDFFAAFAKECPEYMAELAPKLEFIAQFFQNIWEQVRKTDRNIPELIFPNLEPTIKENQE